MTLLRVNEIFGPTIQGEGPYTGHHCLFVRTFGCNQECTWCDTAYTWAVSPQKAAKTQSGKQYDKAKECHEITIDKVIEVLQTMWPIGEIPTITVFSGGEPMMQQLALTHLARELWLRYSCPVHIETAGTIAPKPDLSINVQQYVVSPKLDNSGNAYSKRYKPKVLRAFRDEGAYFKFVVSRLRDFEEIDQIVKECNIEPSNVMVMPEGTATERIIQVGKVIQHKALERGYGICLRQHIMLWGEERGH